MLLRPSPDAPTPPDAAPRRARGRTVPLPAAVGVVRTAGCVVAAGLVAGLLVGGAGAGLVHREEAARAAVVAAEAQRVAHEEEAAFAHRARVARAGSARLTAAAVGYAAVRRAEALAAARAAVSAAEAVVVSRSAIADVPARTLTPLEQAADRVAALIETTPEAPAAPAPVPAPAAPASVEAAPAPDPSTATPARRASGAGHAARTGPATGTDPATASVAAPGDAPSTERGGEPSPGSPAAATPAAPVRADDAPVAADHADPDHPHPAAVPPAPIRNDVATLRTLDLTVTAEVLAAARWLTDLSVQAEAAADAAVAAARVARTTAVAVPLVSAPVPGVAAHRVAAADAAPNGRVPVGLLCAPQSAPDALLRCDAAAALDRLAVAYRADTGRTLRVISSYRSLEQQAAMRALRGDLAAAPGRSNHGRAIAVDLAGLGGLGEFTAPAYLWMKAHAGAFGWVHPAAMEPGGSGPPEPWHWEFRPGT